MGAQRQATVDSKIELKKQALPNLNFILRHSFFGTTANILY